jgi:hypothetical protein
MFPVEGRIAPRGRASTNRFCNPRQKAQALGVSRPRPLVPRRHAIPFRLLLVLGTLCPSRAPAKTTEVNVVVDFTPEGRKVAHPDPANPAYYYPVMGGFEELGAGEAGEKAPRQWDVAHVVAVELAKQGYVRMSPTPYMDASGQVTYRDGTLVRVPAHPATGQQLEAAPADGVPLTRAMLGDPESPYYLKARPTAKSPVMDILESTDPVHGPVLKGTPSLIVSFQYGYANPQAASFDGTTSDPITNVTFNQMQMLGLVAGNSVRDLGLDFDRDAVMQRAGQDRYFVMVSAYDFQAYKSGHKVVLLWKAKMSASSDALGQFSDALNALAWAGGPYFGRETKRPATIVLPVTPDGRVEIGTPTVKEYSDTPLPAPAER